MSASHNNQSNNDEDKKDGAQLSPDKIDNQYTRNYPHSERKEFVGIPRKLDFAAEENLSFDAIEEIDMPVKNASAVVGYAVSESSKRYRHS